MNKFIIAPSILSADFFSLGQEINSVLKAGADWIHVDVMDNHFVPNLSIGPQILSSLKKKINTTFDVHLMVSHPKNMIEAFVKSGANYISFHPELYSDPEKIKELIGFIHSLGAKAGLAYDLNKSIKLLPQFMAEIDLILVMSVKAGFGGQIFEPKVLNKVKKIRRWIDSSQRDIRLEIDGGINAQTLKIAKEAGADTFVIGSAIFSEDKKNHPHIIENFKHILT